MVAITRLAIIAYYSDRRNHRHIRLPIIGKMAIFIATTIIITAITLNSLSTSLSPTFTSLQYQATHNCRSHLYTLLTKEANLEACFVEMGADPLRKKRRDTSTRVTFSRPQEAQMDTALEEKAVEKLMRGPTCIREV